MPVLGMSAFYFLLSRQNTLCYSVQNLCRSVQTILKKIPTKKKKVGCVLLHRICADLGKHLSRQNPHENVFFCAESVPFCAHSCQKTSPQTKADCDLLYRVCALLCTQLSKKKSPRKKTDCVLLYRICVVLGKQLSKKCPHKKPRPCVSVQNLCRSVRTILKKKPSMIKTDTSLLCRVCAELAQIFLRKKNPILLFCADSAFFCAQNSQNSTQNQTQNVRSVCSVQNAGSAIFWGQKHRTSQICAVLIFSACVGRVIVFFTQC